MKKLTLKEQSILNNESKIIKAIEAEDAFDKVEDIVSFLKENKLSVGYTKGATANVFTNYVLGLSHINPLEYGLISERGYLQRRHNGHIVPNQYKPFFGILLDKESYKKTQEYLKANKITKAILEFHNIDIYYDKRLDAIKNHKKYTFRELSKLAINRNDSSSIFTINDFNDFIAVHAFKKSEGLEDYWFQELSCNSYNSLVNKFSFLKTKNMFNVILFQEEWMMMMKKITGMSYLEINMFRLAAGRKIKLKGFEQELAHNLKEKYKISGKEFRQVYDTLLSCVCYLPCKANIISDAYIELVSNMNNKE